MPRYVFRAQRSSELDQLEDEPPADNNVPLLWTVWLGEPKSLSASLGIESAGRIHLLDTVRAGLHNEGIGGDAEQRAHGLHDEEHALLLSNLEHVAGLKQR